MALPEDLLQQKIDHLGADDLEDRALRIHTLNEANRKLSVDYERSVDEIKQRLLAMGVSEEIIDQVVIGQIIGDTVGNAQVAYAAERLRGTLGYQAGQLDTQMLGVHEAMKENHELHYKIPFTLPFGSKCFLGTRITPIKRNNYKSFCRRSDGTSEMRGDDTEISINLYGDEIEYNSRARLMRVELRETIVRDAPLSSWDKFRGKIRNTTKSVNIKYGFNENEFRKVANATQIPSISHDYVLPDDQSEQFLENIARLMQNPQNTEQERIQYVTAAVMNALQQVVPRVTEHLRYQHRTLDQLDFNGGK